MTVTVPRAFSLSMYSTFVIPAHAGIQDSHGPRFRRVRDFEEILSQFQGRLN